MENAIENQRRGRTGEGKSAGRHFIEHNSEREEIRPGIELFSAGLLGGHVGDRAHGASRAGEKIGSGLRAGLQRAVARLGRFLRHGELGEAKVQNFRRAARDQEDVRGLDVAMDDAFGVRGVQAIGDLDGHVKKIGQGQGLAGDAVFQGLAFEQLHRDEGAPFKFANVVDGADIGMVQRGSGASFAAEALDGLRILRDIVGKKFERDTASEPGVLGLIDYAHASAANLFGNGVMGNGEAEHRTRVGHGLGV